MRFKLLLPALLALAVLTGGAASSALAQRRGGGFSSGGRSYSSGSRGGSSFSRPSSGGGRSYSSGAPKVSIPSRPAPSPFSRPSGKSYSSGSSTPATKVPSPASRPTSPSGKSYSSGSSSAAPAGRPSASSSKRGPSFDAAAADALRKVESRRSYTRANAPRPEYHDQHGTAHPIDPRSPKVEDLRRRTDHQRWVTRRQRQERDFGPYQNQPVIIYHDPFNSFFWYWLLARDLETRALWTYNHRQDMDDARYRDLLQRDAKLQERVKELEAQGQPRDPTYVPPGIDPDLMYTDDYVDSVINPQPPRRASFAGGLHFLLRALMVLVVLVFLIWLVFFKRWGGDTNIPVPDHHKNRGK